MLTRAQFLTFIFGIDPLMRSTADSRYVAQKPVEVSKWLCPTHGPLEIGAALTVTGTRDIAANFKAHYAGPICIYCQTDYIQSVTPKLVNIK